MAPWVATRCKFMIVERTRSARARGVHTAMPKTHDTSVASERGPRELSYPAYSPPLASVTTASADNTFACSATARSREGPLRAFQRGGLRRHAFARFRAASCDHAEAHGSLRHGLVKARSASRARAQGRETGTGPGRHSRHEGCPLRRSRSSPTTTRSTWRRRTRRPRRRSSGRRAAPHGELVCPVLCRSAPPSAAFAWI